MDRRSWRTVMESGAFGPASGARRSSHTRAEAAAIAGVPGSGRWSVTSPCPLTWTAEPERGEQAHRVATAHAGEIRHARARHPTALVPAGSTVGGAAGPEVGVGAFGAPLSGPLGARRSTMSGGGGLIVRCTP